MFIIVPPEIFDINLFDLKKFVGKKGYCIKVEGKLGLTFILKNVKASVLKSGVTILEGIKNKDEALKFFKEFTDKYK